MAGMMRTSAQDRLKTDLSDKSSIGRIIDREGVGSIKPVLQDRWSVANENLKLETGDLIMTGTRGANALTLHLANGTQLILGPGTLLELQSTVLVKLFRGEMEITAPDGITITVVGFKNEKIDVAG